ncbi:MAG: hypothetical protein ACYSTS_16760 [Planctomycetota bacterium]|jgi:hypothetical protein
MIQPLENIPKTRVKLTVPLIASYLSCNYNVTSIAKATGQGHQWVSEFIKKNYDALLPLIDKQDVYAAMQAKHVAHKAKEKLNDIIDTCNDFNKRDLIPLTAVSDRHTQQYRLLSDKSTANVSIDQVHANREELRARKEMLLARLKEIRGERVEG